MFPDLIATLAALRQGQTSAAREIDRSLAAAHSPACAHAFVRLMESSARAEAAAAHPAQPLAGLAVSAKDLFDVQGQPTPAGSQVLAHAPAAQRDAPALARLRAAGGALLGRTHMVEFAFSGMGTNPHAATPAAVDGRFGALAGEPRVPGGSSSGAAVSVASGAAFIGLGSDTGGSIRIPAALCGIVGFKSTARLVPTDGATPLSPTLDTACALTRSVRDAVLAHEILAARTVTRSSAPLSAWRLAVPTTLFFEDIEAPVARAWERALGQLRAAGAQIDEIALPATAELAQINARGGFAAAESWAWHRHLLAAHGAQYDPRVKSRIERGAAMSAADYIDLVHARAQWMARMQRAMAGYDALLSPTVPIVAPTLASVDPQRRDCDDAFLRANALLLRNTSVVNLLDGCALSLPCHQAGELPVGLMAWHAALHDDAVLAVGLQIEQTLQKQ